MLKEGQKKAIIKYYMEVKSIKKVMDKFKVSKTTIYGILKENQIPIPSEFQNAERDNTFNPEYPFVDSEGNKSDKIVFKISSKFIDESGVEEDSIIEKFKQLKILNENDDVDSVNLIFYAQKKYNLDVRDFLSQNLFNYIFNRELNKLQTDLQEIKEFGYIKDSNNTVETMLNEFQVEMLNALLDSFKRPQIIKEKLKEDNEPVINPQMLIIMFNPSIP